MQRRFLIAALLLVSLAFLVAYGGQSYVRTTTGGVAPVNSFGLLAAGLAIAAGLSLIADAIRDRNDR